MNAYREKSRSCWMDVEVRPFPELGENITSDAVVVGSGIAGLSTAYELVRQGRKVVVLDRGPIGRGMTARTSAHLTSALDDFYHEFIAIRGERIARLHFESQAAAIDRIEEIQNEERIECDFDRMDAHLFLAGDAKPETLERERVALRTVGLAGARMVLGESGKHKLSNGPCLIIPQQGRFHPLRYLDGVAEASARLGADIFANTCVTGLDETKDGVEVQTRSGQRVSADVAIVATNTPINDRLTIHAKQAPYRTYVLAGEIPSESIADRLYWDTEEPYHYVRLHPWGISDLLLVGGEDHKSGTVDDASRRFAELEKWARERFPELGEVRYRWSGQVIETMDYAAFIGLNPGNERIYVATGDSGQGITHGVVASRLIAALLQDGTHPWAEVYEPSRKPLRATGHLLSESIDVVKGLAQHLLPGEISSENELAPGAGGIMRVGLGKVAVCRDEQGEIHRHSATCSHVGCVVHWNSFEQCWDCPCHGSHFAPDGTVLNAPAIENLAPAKVAATTGQVAAE